ncbi:MAG: response regulator transcription factor [Pseudomonadales bacterium]|nr:response regulator transcription factor [Pseudomonadales bacterium]
MRVLLVEDNAGIAGNIAEYLELRDMSVDFAYRGEAALQRLEEQSFDVVILDVMMPGMDGLAVCDHLRHRLQLDVPVLFLTARDTLDDKLAGFARGGDDYLVKPFQLPELEARLQALVTRHQGRLQQTVSVGSLELDLRNQQARLGETPLALDRVQFRLLSLLVQQAPAVVRKTDLEYHLWREEALEGSVLRTHIYRLRKQLPEQSLETVRGQGYRLCEQRLTAPDRSVPAGPGPQSPC